MPRNDSRAGEAYFASMCNALAELADRSGFDLGAHSLKMASLEFKRHLSPAERRAGP
jgi:hypothetical protein